MEQQEPLIAAPDPAFPKWVYGVFVAAALVIVASAVLIVRREHPSVQAMRPATQPVRTTPIAQSRPALLDMSAQELYATCSPSVVKITVIGDDHTELGFGSGFIFSGDGMLATNFHVVRDAADLRVQTVDGSDLRVLGLVGCDAEDDVAVVKVAKSGVPPLPLNTSLPAVGTKVFAIGHPEGLANSLSEGIVSGVRDSGKIQGIQTTAAISHGSSGGPLLSSDGRVLGIVKSFEVDGQNLNFAATAQKIESLTKPPVAVHPIHWARTVRDEAGRRLFASARMLADSGNVSGAMELLTSHLEDQKLNPDYWFTIGVLAAGEREWKAALTAFQMATTLRPTYANAWYNIGVTKERLEDWTGARSALLVAFKNDRKHADTCIELAKISHREGNKSEWLTWSKRAYDLAPDSSEARMQLGRAAMDEGYYTQSINALAKEVEKNPASVSARLYLADAYGRNKQPIEAITVLEDARHIDPENTDVLMSLGAAYQMRSHWDLAIKCYEKVIELRPRTELANQARDEMMGIKNNPH